MRLIDADALLERMMKDPLFPLVERYGVSGVIEAEPTVDAVEVVRCKDCRWYAGEGMHCANNIVVQFDHFFCYYGERREADGTE